MASLTAGAVVKGTSTVVSIVDKILADLVSLSNPVTATAVVAFILQVTPVDIPSTTLVSIVAGVGVASLAIRNLFDTITKGT